MARELLGKTLVHLVNGQRLAGRIVETEAYAGILDKACHSYGDRRTARTESLYLDGGHVYVFLIYGMYACFNVVTRAAGIPEAVLIRALEPTEGLETMRLNRQPKKVKDDSGALHFNSQQNLDPQAHHSAAPRKELRPFEIANGPGKLCRALAVDRSLDRASLLNSSSIWIEETPLRDGETIHASKRVGIDYAEEAVDWLFRFSVESPAHGHRHVSKPWPSLQAEK